MASGRRALAGSPADDDSPVRFLAFTRGLQATDLGYRVVDDLSLEGRHAVERLRTARLLDPSGHLASPSRDPGPLALAIVLDVHLHQAAALNQSLDAAPDQFLKGIQGVPALPASEHHVFVGLGAPNVHVRDLPGALNLHV